MQNVTLREFGVAFEVKVLWMNEAILSPGSHPTARECLFGHWMTLARLVGIDVPPVKLVDVDAINNLPKGTENLKGQALAIERFDRLSDGTKVHIEDFAQIFGVTRAISSMSPARVMGFPSGRCKAAKRQRRTVLSLNSCRASYVTAFRPFLEAPEQFNAELATFVRERRED